MGHAEKPVDLQHLDRYTGGERSLDEEILKLFEQQCQEIMLKLERLAQEHGDAKAWIEVTHSLKGAARGIGAFPLADAAAEAEKYASDKVAAVAALQAIKIKAAAVQAFIEKFLKAEI